MATKPRKQSESGFYHVFQRGVNHFDIFEDDEDRRFFLNRLARYAKELNVEIHAWCLMSNHTHLLLRAGPKELPALMRKIGAVYARKFNMRHGRSGPLFEGRYGSVGIETESQLMTTIRYIHRNPSLHNESVTVTDYPWSSYSEYANASPVLCQLKLGLELFGGVDELIRLHAGQNSFADDCDRHLDIETCGPMGDDEARRRANLVLAEEGLGVTVSQIGALPRDKRNHALACIKRLVGCSLRQIQRLTAIAYSAIRGVIGCESEIPDGGDRARWVDLPYAQPAALLGTDSKLPRLPILDGFSIAPMTSVQLQ